MTKPKPRKKNKSKSTTVTATMRIDLTMNLVLQYLAEISNGEESRNSLVNAALAKTYDLGDLLPKAESHFAGNHALTHTYTNGSSPAAASSLPQAGQAMS